MNTDMTIATVARCLEVMINKDIPVFLHGKPGIGKSEVVHQVGKAMGRNVIDFRLNIRDQVDVRGLPFIDAKNGCTRWLPPNELPQEKRDGKCGILFLDEMNTASKAMESAALGLIQERRYGEYHLPPGWVPIAAGNRLADRATAQRLGTAMKNRFAHFDVVTDVNDWTKWALANSIDPMMAAFMRFRPELLHKMPQGEENAFPTPRAWTKTALILDEPEAIRFHLAAAIVGPGPAAELEGFLRLFGKLPTFEEMLRNPTLLKGLGTTEVSLRYAAASRLAFGAIKTNFAQVIECLRNLPKEFEIMGIVDAVRRDALLMKTNSFVKWAVANQEVVV